MFCVKTHLFFFSVAAIFVRNYTDARLQYNDTRHSRDFTALPLIFESPPRNDVTITQDDIDELKNSYGLKKDSILRIQEIYPSNMFMVNGRKYMLDKLERVEIFSKNGIYMLDGKEQVIPEAKVFSKVEDDKQILVLFDWENRLKSILIFDKATGTTVAELVATSEKYLVTLTNDDFDYGELNDKYKFPKDDDELSTNHSILEDVKTNHQQIPTNNSFLELMATNQEVNKTNFSKRLSIFRKCEEYQIIEIAVDYESSFCSHHGGADESFEAFVAVIAATSVKYQQQGLCRKIFVSHLNAHCNTETDPYLDIVAQNLSGCGGYGLLTYFGDSLRNNTNITKRDASILFSGTGLECDEQEKERCIVGCANLSTLCDNDVAYGVTYVTFVNSTDFRATLVAHELGHVSGARHMRRGRGRYIMEPSIRPNVKGFGRKSMRQMNCFMKRSNCPRRFVKAQESIFRMTIEL